MSNSGWRPMKTAARELAGRETAWVKAVPASACPGSQPTSSVSFSHLEKNYTVILLCSLTFFGPISKGCPLSESLQDSDSKGNSAAPGLFLCFSHFPSGTNLGQQLWQVPEQRCWGPGDCLV